MAKNTHIYTQYFEDGRVNVSPPMPKMEYADLRKAIGGMVEVIPADYYASKKWGNCTVYGFEEARFANDVKRNPHFDVLHDPQGNEWDVVGVLLKEETVANHAKYDPQPPKQEATER